LSEKRAISSLEHEVNKKSTYAYTTIDPAFYFIVAIWQYEALMLHSP